MTLVLVVFDKLSTGQPDFLRYISPVLLFLLPAIPKAAQPKQSQKHVMHPHSSTFVHNKQQLMGTEQSSYRFLNGSMIKCLSSPNRAKERRPWFGKIKKKKQR